MCYCGWETWGRCILVITEFPTEHHIPPSQGCAVLSRTEGCHTGGRASLWCLLPGSRAGDGRPARAPQTLPYAAAIAHPDSDHVDLRAWSMSEES